MSYTHFDKIAGVSGLAVGARGAEKDVILPNGRVKSSGATLLAETLLITETLQSGAATAANYGPFFIAPFPCEVVSVREIHTAIGTDAGAVTLDIEKLTGTQAPDAGVTVLAANINLKGIANTVQTPAISGNTANRQLATGNRLCLKDAGVLTAVAGVSVAVELKAI